ncbi:MAG: hypothetical protein A2X71_02305 [Thiobacillus sp. GWE1_62_9]|nr:MAG: hypothetical protein A2X71_02305 [Thiobacillus sp. GWE1_62_9]
MPQTYTCRTSITNYIDCRMVIGRKLVRFKEGKPPHLKSDGLIRPMLDVANIIRQFLFSTQIIGVDTCRSQSKTVP